MKQEFVSVVSHELRTPLTSIRGALGLLTHAGGTLSLAKNQQLLDLANRNAERLAVLIDDILDMEKIESGKMRFDFANHGLVDLLSQAVTSNQTYAERLGVALHLQPLSDDVLVNVDANRLLQVMNNLLSNAAKFSPQGKAVDVGAAVLGSVVRISVTDRGPGISTEFQTKIFGKFCQGDKSDSRKKGGSGLGLAISKAIVEIMKGAIGFTTASGRGTTFYVDLPVVPRNIRQLDAQQSKLVSIDLMATDPHIKATARAG
jgi:signal transduction histidine kinase